MYPNTQLFIDGAWYTAASGHTRRSSTLPPAERSARSPRPSVPTSTARSTRPTRASGLEEISAFERSKIMRKAAKLMRERVEAIAPLLTQEQGKTLAEAKAEILAGADVIDWFAEEARRAYGRVIPPRAEGVYQLVIKEPVGPVAAFSPWNFPINQAVRKISAALAAGCSIIIKAPEETPRRRRN